MLQLSIVLENDEGHRDACCINTTSLDVKEWTSLYT